jgi:vesicle transport through interaction with t-SNAREs 1
MELISSYQQDLLRLLETISTTLDHFPTYEVPSGPTSGGGASAGGESRKKLLSQMERDIEESEEILGQMDLEIRSLPHAQRIQFLQKWKAWQNDILKYKKEFKRFRTSYEQTENRTALLGDQEVAPELNVTNEDQLARLLKSTKKLEQSSKTLDDAHTIAIETGNCDMIKIWRRL